MNRVLLVAPTSVAAERAGPAIRYWELARALAAQQPVTLLVPNADHPTHPDFDVRCCEEAEFDELVSSCQVVVVQGPAFQMYPRLIELLAVGGQRLAVDLYDPITLEQLDIDPGGAHGQWLNLEYTALLNEQMRLGDVFFCANERQRDYWLGALSALGRVNPHTYDRAGLRRLIDVVPFGLPSSPPQSSGPVLKGVVSGIASTDRVILWGGGLWEWLDPLTPIRAMEQVAARHPAARLVFFDTPRYHSSGVERARQLAAGLGLLDSRVVFAPWLPPGLWGACLLEADVGLSFHRDSVETHFAARTRLLDYIWAGLPIVCAAGDLLGDRAAALGVAHAVEPGDRDGLAAALIAVLDEPDARSRRAAAFQELAAGLSWAQAAAPLLCYCRDPWPAGDAGREGYLRRQAAADRLLSELAAARRELATLRPQLDAATADRDQAVHRAEQAEAREAGLAKRMARAEASLHAALNGRVMRLLLGTQRAWHSIRELVAVALFRRSP